jgi:nucleoside-diphosphate-sugar epimerase
MIMNRRIFVTGEAGFIGSTLAGRLVENKEVVVYHNFSRSPWIPVRSRRHSSGWRKTKSQRAA